MTNDVLADAADDGTLDSSHATSSHHYQLGFLLLSNATDSLSWVLVRLATQLEMQLQPYGGSSCTSVNKLTFNWKENKKVSK